MKTMRKIMALVLTFALALTLAIPAFAASNGYVDDPADLGGHVYNAYKIFKGTQTAAPDTSAELGNIEWGDNFKGSDFLTALKGDSAFNDKNDVNAFADCGTAAAVAEVLSAKADDSDFAKEFAAVAYKYIGTNAEYQQVAAGTTMEAGYYLIVDVTTDVPVEYAPDPAKPDDKVTGDNAYNLALLQLTKKGTLDINVKVEVPDVEKEVATALTCNSKDEDHVHNKNCYSWANANNASLGDTVTFNVTGTVPASAVDYDYYYYIINDTLSTGLTYVAGSVTVTIGGEAATAGTDYNVKVDGQNIQIALINAIANAGESVEVLYQATLNNSAVIGVEGNPNKVKVDFSNKPNFDYDGTKDNQNLGFPDSTTPHPMGETPESETQTFVTGLEITKVDENGEILTGAEFTITGEGVNVVLKQNVTFTEDADGTWYLLKDGKSYTETAPVMSDYMAPAEEGAEKGYVVESDVSYDKDNPNQADWVVIGGETYRPYVPDDDAGRKVFILVKSNLDEYTVNEGGGVDTYARSVSYETVTTTKGEDGSVTVAQEVDANGVATFVGLKAGTYTVSETKTPAGYNTIKDFNIEIKWDAPTAIGGTCTWTLENGSDTVTANADGLLAFTVENQKGSTLPETGGIGTTIFYALGAVLVIGAGVLFITKKRMGEA